MKKDKEKKNALKEWFKSLNLGKPQGLMLVVTLIVLVIAFLIFNGTSVATARKWDIEWGYYAILSTFVVGLVGVVVNLPFIAKHIRGYLPGGKSLCGLAVLLLVFSVFIF